MNKEKGLNELEDIRAATIFIVGDDEICIFCIFAME